MFITFEGIEGSSKSTQAKLLSKWLRRKGVDNLLTKEPGTILSKTCQQLRQLILNPKSDITARAEFFLYLADRAQHVEKYIMPALKEEKWVISDRYADSTYVYQGWGRNKGLGIDSDEILDIMQHATLGLTPDITFIMDLPVEIGLERAKKSNTEFKGGDRMELEDIKFHERLRSGFLQVADMSPVRCKVLNAEKSVEELHKEIIEVVSLHMGKEDE